MHNFFTIETEAEARRQELERMAAADARAARASQASRMWRRLPRLSRSTPAATIRDMPSTPLGALLEMRRVPRPVAC